MKKPAQPIGRVIYLSGVNGAVKDIANGCAELHSAITEARDETSLLELRQISIELILKLRTVEAAALDKLAKL